MYGEGGRNIYDLENNPNAVQGLEYDWYCPITLDQIKTDPQEHGGINKNAKNYFNNLNRKAHFTLVQSALSTKLFTMTKSSNLLSHNYVFIFQDQVLGLPFLMSIFTTNKMGDKQQNVRIP